MKHNKLEDHQILMRVSTGELYCSCRKNLGKVPEEIWKAGYDKIIEWLKKKKENKITIQ